jgi:hypothetical protein
MRFLSRTDAQHWCEREAITSAEGGRPTLRCAFPDAGTKLPWFAAWLAVAVPGISERLLWVTETGVWPSSENWTLVSRLRAGYGETRSVDDAPAIVTSAEETEDLAAFVLLALLSGWDARLVGTQDLLRVSISHDEWIEFSADGHGLIDQLRSELRAADIRILEPRAV